MHVLLSFALVKAVSEEAWLSEQRFQAASKARIKRKIVREEISDEGAERHAVIVIFLPAVRTVVVNLA